MIHIILAALYIQAGGAYEQHAKALPAGVYCWSYDITEVRDPYGIVAVGFDHDAGNWNYSLSARHISSMATRMDHGTNTIELNVKWHPFK